MLLAGMTKGEVRSAPGHKEGSDYVYKQRVTQHYDKNTHSRH